MTITRYACLDLLAQRPGQRARSDAAPAHRVHHRTLDAPRRRVFASDEYLEPGFYGDGFHLPEPAARG
jgi:hypothetical protein